MVDQQNYATTTVEARAIELELEILLVASLLTYWEVPMDKAGL